MLNRKKIADIIQVGLYLFGLYLVLKAATSPHDAMFYKRYDKANAVMFLFMATIIFIDWCGNDLKRSVAMFIWALTLWNAKDFILGTEKTNNVLELVYDVFVGLMFIGNLIYIGWNYYKHRRG
jgi:hypothetical protein